MKKNKGFTLIELLAVIVVLAIIAIIAVPAIAKVVDNARKKAALTSAQGYIDAVENYMAMHELNSDKYPYDLKNNTWNISTSTTNEISLLNIIESVKAESITVPALNDIIKVKGEKPTSGTLTINNKGKVTSGTIIIKKYVIGYDGTKCTYQGEPGVTIASSETTVYVGGTLQLNVTTVPANQTVTYESSNTSVATVSNTGVVTGVSVGNVTITVHMGSKSDKITLTVKQPSVPTMDEMCPGCQFVYTTDELTIGTSTAPEGTTNDYTTLTSTHPYFLGIITNSSTGVIERTFACGVEGTTPFCLEGYDTSKWSDEYNVGTLNTIFPSCNASASGSYADCLGSSVDADANSNGNVGVYDDGGSCNVLSDGSAGCG